jgi:hypothetical protein
MDPANQKLRKLYAGQYRTHLSFPGCCGRDSCCAGTSCTGTVRFGQNEFDSPTEQVFESPCDTCNEAWDERYGFLEGLTVTAQVITLYRRNRDRRTVHLDSDDLDRIVESSSKVRLVLRPFVPAIRFGIQLLCDIRDTADSMADFADAYNDRQLPR